MRLFIIITSLVFLYSCTNDHSKSSTAVTLLVDRTDTIIPSPQPGIVQELVGTGTVKHSGIIFRFQNIGNTDYNSTYKAELPGQSAMRNKLILQAETQKFFRKIDTLILRENNRDFQYQTSSVFTPLIKELTTISEENASDKIVVIWSDLGEISDLFNHLMPRSRRQLLEDPETVGEHFKNQLSIPDLNGVSLYIVHFPETREQNRLFRAFCKVYEQVFKGSGLELHIGLDQRLKL